MNERRKAPIIRITLFSDSLKSKPSKLSSLTGRGGCEPAAIGCITLTTIIGLLVTAYILLVNNHIIGP